ncbi:hypothetical protein ACWGI1_00245 [Streptomyces sp. NPDC054835]
MPNPSIPDPVSPVARLSTFLLQADAVMAAWDRYDDEHTDLDGWPYDQDAYDTREAERDHALWRAFQPLGEVAPSLLYLAEAAVDHLRATSLQARWPWQLSQLRDSLERVDAAEKEFAERTAASGTDYYASGEEAFLAFAARNAAASAPVTEWLTHGRAVLEINAATVRAGQTGIRLAARTPRAAAPAAPARHR